MYRPLSNIFELGWIRNANGLEKLIQELPDAIRPITLLKHELDAEFKFELLDDPTNSLSLHIDLPPVHPTPAVPKFSLFM